MIFTLKSKAFFQFPSPSLSIRTPYLRWVSTFSTTINAPLQIPQSLEDLCTFFHGRTNQTHTDYELTLVSALKSCSSDFSLSKGLQIHSLILKSGLHSNYFINNSLINLYARCGFLENARYLFDSCSKLLDTVSCNIMIAGYGKFGPFENARQLFEIMPHKNLISYTTMIMGLVSNKYWAEAIEVFKDMRSMGFIPNEVVMVNVITACLQLGRGSLQCQMFHALLTKLQLMGSIIVSTNLLNVYCGCLRVVDARKLFDQMPERNIVTWNALLNGYSKAGLVHQARELFERFPNKDVVSWGTIMDAHIQVEMFSEALMLYCDMLRTGMAPNDVMIVDIMSTCGKLMVINEGKQFHGVVLKSGFDCYDVMQATIINFYAACGRMTLACLQFEMGIKDHVPSWNALIAGYIRNGMIDQARDLFNHMPERDVFSWSSMISGYAQSEQPNDALELFHEMITSGIKPNEITMVSVFSAIANLGTLPEGRWVHQYVLSSSIPLDDNLRAAIIDMYAKCGSLNTALELFNQIRNKVYTVSPWNAIICGLAMHGHAKLSLEIFLDLQRLNIKLNSITFLGVLSACCHAGLVEDGKRYFESMKNVYNIEPNIKHYGCMLDLLGRAGRVEEAEEMIKKMPMKADVIIWGTLLAASKTNGNVVIGERAAENLSRLQPSHGASRVLLSNIYADAGRWEEAFLVRREMQMAKLKKSPGCSRVV